ncbi:MAG TPA: YncE family protein [Candidatus Udaeobacter sp.]|nr:YncE family protein [Candidatus Udaeobacter sp.]
MSASFARRIAWLAAAVACVGVPRVTAGNSPLLQLRATIGLPGVQGRIDHLAFDAAGERLFVCALGNNTVEVVDLRKGKRIHSITGLSAPQGIACIPEPNRIFVATDKGGICKVYDGDSFQELKELDLQDDADNVRYDAATKKIFVGFGSGGIAVIDAANGRQIGSIKLSAHPEAFALEQHGNRMFVNVPDARHVAVLDREKGEVISKWQTDLAFGNFPMALDESNHRLFVGCRLPSKLVVLNTESGNAVAKIDISADGDEVFYDSKRRRIYAVCGAGNIDIIDQNDPNTYVVATTINTADGARTGLFVPERDALFVAVPHRGSQRAEIREYKIE